MFAFRLLLWFDAVVCSISCLSVCCFVLYFVVGGVWFGLPWLGYLILVGFDVVRGLCGWFVICACVWVRFAFGY